MKPRIRARWCPLCLLRGVHRFARPPTFYLHKRDGEYVLCEVPR